MTAHPRVDPRRLLPCALVLALAFLSIASPGDAAASTPIEASARSDLLVLVNGARASLGLRPLRGDSRLNSLAIKRARYMTQTGQLSHSTYGGDIVPAVTATGVPWISLGEAVAMTSYAEPTGVARALFDLWRDSPPHWALITSRTFNYIGLGVAVTAGGAPYGDLVFAETADRTAPVPRMTSGAASGRTVTWRWAATDVALQTRTAGVCTFDVQYRVDAGTWKLLRTRTTSRSLTLGGRPAGHVYSVRVRARDCAGNLSPWSPVKAVRVR